MDISNPANSECGFILPILVIHEYAIISTAYDGKTKFISLCFEPASPLPPREMCTVLSQFFHVLYSIAGFPQETHNFFSRKVCDD